MKLRLNKALLTAVMACFAATQALADYTWSATNEDGTPVTTITAANWASSNSWTLSGTTTFPTGGSGPGTPNSNAWEKIVIENASTESALTLEGWNLRLDLSGNSNVEFSIKKSQGTGTNITVHEGSTLTLNWGAVSGSSNDAGKDAVTLDGGTMNVVLHRNANADANSEGTGATNVDFGTLTGTAVGTFNISSSAENTARTFNHLTFTGVLDASATSDELTLHSIKLGTYTSDITLSDFNANITATDSSFLNAGGSILTASTGDVGKYSVVNDNGTITLYYVTGTVTTTVWALSEGASATLSEQSFGTPVRLTLGVTSTETAGDVANYTIDSEYAVSLLKVEGGAAQLTIAENASFEADLTSIGDGASLSYTGEGDLVLHQDASSTAVSSLTGKLTVKGATLSAGTGNGQTFTLDASEIVLTEGATLQMQASGHDFTQKVTMDNGTVYVVDGSNTHFKFNGGIEVGSGGATISSQYDKHFDLNSAITGSGTLKLITTKSSSWGRAAFYLDSSVADGVNLEVSNSILNIKEKASFGTGTIKLVSSDAKAERQTSQVNLEKDITLKFTSDSVGIVNVNGHTLSMTPTGTTTEGFRFAGTGTINLTASSNASLTASTNEALQSTFTGTINIDTTNSHMGVVGSGQLFKADADGNYASLNFTSGASGKVFGIGASFTESNALKIGNLTSEHSNIEIRGDWDSGNNTTRYLEVHQTLDDATFSGIFADSTSSGRRVGLIKEGVGNLNLTGANTAAAKLVVNGGSVTLKDSGSWAGDIEVGADGTLAFNGTGKEIAAGKNITFADGATLAVTGGDLTVNKDFANTEAAKLVVNSSSVTLKDSGSWAGDIEVGADGTLAFNGTGKEIAADKNITFADGATLAVTGGDLTVKKDVEICKVAVDGTLTVDGELRLRSYDVELPAEEEGGETTTETYDGTVTISKNCTLTVNSKTVKVRDAAESATITGTGKVSVATSTLTYTNADITADSAEINATLTNVALTTSTATTFSGTQKLTSLTAGGTVTVAEEGSVTATSVTNDTLTLAGAGSFSTGSALKLAGASTIGDLTAKSLAFGDGASLHSTGTLTLTDNTTITVGSLAGISSSNQLLTATGGVTSIVLDVSLDNLKNGTFDNKGTLEIASITNLASATFAGGKTDLEDKDNKRNYTISVENGVVSIVYESTASGWISSGDWTDGGTSEFSEKVTSASDAGFLGEGSESVNVDGDKTVSALIVDVAPDADVKKYTFTGSSITTGDLFVTVGSMEIQNKITANTTEVAANGTLTVGEKGTLNAGTATGTITNNGTLSVGDGSVITLGGSGNLTVTGEVTLKNNVKVAKLAGSGTLTVQCTDSTLTLGSTDANCTANICVNTLVVSDSAATTAKALNLGNLDLDTIKFDRTNVAGGTAALITATSISSTQITLDLDTTTTLGAGTYDLIELTGADATMSLSDYKLDEDTLAAYQDAGLAVGLDVSGKTLSLKVLTDTNRTWNTANGYVEDALGNKITLDLAGTTTYHCLDNVGHVNVNGDKTIDLTSDAPASASVPAKGLVVNNLSGDGVHTLSIVGDGIGEDIVTLATAEDYAPETAANLSLSGLSATLDGDLTLNDLTVSNAYVDAAGNTLTVSTLAGDGTLAGKVVVTKSSTAYTGSYEGAVVDIQGGTQTLAANAGLTLTGTGGTAVLTVGGSAAVTAINTTDANVTLDNGGVNTLTLGTASSMTGGTLALSVAGEKVSTAVNGGTIYSATTGAALTLTNTTVQVTVLGSVGDLSSATGETDVILFRISDDPDSSVEGCTLSLVNGASLDKYFTNIRLVNGSIDVVGTRRTDYYSSSFTNLSENGQVGVDFASYALSYKDPQGNRGKFGDIAKVLDALDDCVATGNRDGADKLGAAFAGAGTAAMGLAFSSDMERQLRAIRNRTTTMGVNEDVVNEDMPYFNAWVNAEGDSRQFDASGTLSGYKLSSWGCTVGFDVDLTPNFTMGLAITAMSGDLKAESAENKAEGDLNTYYLSLFGRYEEDSWVHTFVASFGIADASMSRTVACGNYGSYTTDGNTSGAAFGLLYEVGYVIALDEDSTACLQPIVNIAYKHTQIAGYTESGSDAALEVGGQTMDTVTFGIGARFQAVVGETVYNRTSILELRALAKIDVGDSANSVSVSMVNVPGINGTVKSAEVDAFGVELGAGLTIPLGQESGALFMDASCELRGSYTNVNGTFGYRINF